jgi:hypothetical protein
MEVDRVQHQVALDTPASEAMEPLLADNVRVVLTNGVAFMDAALKKGVVEYADLHRFATAQAPYLAKNVAWRPS